MSGKFELEHWLPGHYQHWQAQQEDQENYQWQTFLRWLEAPLRQQLPQLNVKTKPALAALNTELWSQHSALDLDLSALPKEQQFNIKAIFAEQNRSLVNLQSLLECLFSELQVSIREFANCRRILAKDRLAALNGGTQVGENAMLGYRTDDCLNRIQVRVSTLGDNQLQQVVQADYLTLIRNLIDRLLQRPIEVELLLILQNGALSSAQLGNEQSALLGQKFWLAGNTGQVEHIKLMI